MLRIFAGDTFYPWVPVLVLALIILDVALIWSLF